MIQKKGLYVSLQDSNLHEKGGVHVGHTFFPFLSLSFSFALPTFCINFSFFYTSLSYPLSHSYTHGHPSSCMVMLFHVDGRPSSFACARTGPLGLLFFITREGWEPPYLFTKIPKWALLKPMGTPPLSRRGEVQQDH